jgi:hypothetical protein
MDATNVTQLCLQVVHFTVTTETKIGAYPLKPALSDILTHSPSFNLRVGQATEITDKLTLWSTMLKCNDLNLLVAPMVVLGATGALRL